MWKKFSTTTAVNTDSRMHALAKQASKHKITTATLGKKKDEINVKKLTLNVQDRFTGAKSIERANYLNS